MRAFLITMCLFAASGCASIGARSQDVPWPERVAGCYHLAPGAWQSDPVLARFFPPQQIPTYFRLDAARLQGWEPLQSDSLPLYAVQTNSADQERGPVFVYWSRTGFNSDTIHVGYPLPVGGASLRLWPRGRNLMGYVTTFTDAIPPDGVNQATAPIVARKVDCAEPQARAQPLDAGDDTPP